MVKGAYHHGDLREALIRAGIDQLQRGESGVGQQDVSLRDIARAVGVSPMAAYRHFASKDAFLAAIAARGFAELTAKLTDAANTKSSPGQRLIDAGIAYVGFARAQPALFRLMFAGALPREDDGQPTGAQTLDILVHLIANAAELKQDDPALHPRVVRAWSLVHGYAMLLLDNRLLAASETDAFLHDLLTIEAQNLTGPSTKFGSTKAT